MDDSQSDSLSSPTAPAKAEDARSALRTAEWISDEEQFRSGELPLWNRLGRTRKAPQRYSWIACVSWVTVLGLALVALLRVVWHDGAWPLVLINAFTMYVYLPAYVVFVYALARRRRALSIASAAVVAAHMAFIWPDFRPPQLVAVSSATGERAANSVRIYYANVHGSNLRMDEILAEARRFDPDVIVLVEMQRWWWMEMIDRRPLADFPYGTNLDRRNAGDVGVFSRLPVRRFEQIAIAGRTVLTLDLVVGDETLRLYALHSPRPTPDSRDSYGQFWELITRVVTEDQGAVAVIGDFNATQHSRVYRQLQEGGLRSAHEDRGRGLANTWPQAEFLFPLIRIDQVFLSAGVECVSIQEGDAPGSDHRSLLVELTVATNPPGHADR